MNYFCELNFLNTMTEFKMLMGPIIRGEYEKVKNGLDTQFPKDGKLMIEDEPYCNLQGRQTLRTFKLILDDPRFVFDDLFIARQLYFSAPSSQNLVMKHPKFRNVVNARAQFTEYFYERYGNAAAGTQVGMYQRYYQAERAIRFWQKQNRQRLVFDLYPALVHYVRSFKERYYAPEGPGYYKVKQHFYAELGKN